MVRGRSVAAMLVLFALVFAPAAWAQSTGGSFGGGSFSSGGSSSSGSSSYGGSSGSYGSGSYSSGSYGSGSSGGGSGGGAPMPAWLWWIGGPLLGAYVVVMIYNASIPGGIAGRRRIRKLWRGVAVSELRLGIDWRARREVQARLMELANTGDTRSQRGLAKLLSETLALLRGTELSWLYAAVSTRSFDDGAETEAEFRRLASDARARFQRELVRAADGDVRGDDAPAVRAQPEEGEGVVVVTVVVAAHGAVELDGSDAPADAAKRLLETMRTAANPEKLLAIEVAWSPAAEEDRMSTAELEQHYPELRKIDEAAIAGRVFCSYCRGPFARELLACPHCGAPIGEDAASA